MRTTPESNLYPLAPGRGQAAEGVASRISRFASSRLARVWIRSLAKLDWYSWLAFALPFLIYVLTLAPTIYNLDSAELTTAAYTGGLMRTTGYPFYLTIGYLWSHIPLGDVGYRMNLFSAVCGALTVHLAARILRRWHIGGWATFGALGLLATSTFFWGLSLVAEVYTLHTAIMASLILALLRWREQPSPGRLALVGLLGGIGMTHHAAMVLLVPGSLFYVFTSHPKKLLEVRSLLAAAAGTLLGLSFYLYLPLRYLAQPAFNYAGIYTAGLEFTPVNLTTLDGLWWLISGKAFAGMMLAYSPQELAAEGRMFATQLWQAFFAAGIAPGLLGLALLWRRDWRAGGMLALMFALSAGFYINYRVMDKDTMYLPAYLAWALWVGVGYQSALDWIRQIDQETWRRRTLNAAWAVMLGGVLLALVWNWRLVDLSDDWSTRQRGEEILSLAGPNALVFGWWNTVPVVQYLQLVEGQRPDVRAVNRFLIPSHDLIKTIIKEVAYRPIYIDSPPRNLPARLRAVPNPPVYQILPRSRLTTISLSRSVEAHRSHRR